MKNQGIQYFSTSRGCPFNCTFCMHTAYKEFLGPLGNKQARFSPEYIVHQISTLKKKWNLSRISFICPNLVENVQWLKKMARLYKRSVNLPFTCFVRFEDINKESILILKNSDCDGVAVGLESGNDIIRNKVLKKSLSKKTILDKAKLLRQYNIPFLTFNMICIPNETITDVIETLEINRMIGPEHVYCSIFYPIPGTPIEKSLKNSGMSLSQSNDMLMDVSKVHILSGSRKEIERMYSLFYLLVYVPIPISIVKILLRLPLDFAYREFRNLYLRSSKYLGISKEDAKKIF